MPIWATLGIRYQSGLIIEGAMTADHSIPSIAQTIHDSLPSRSHWLRPAARAGLFRDAWRRLLASWNGRVGLGVVTLIVLIAVLAPVIDPYDASTDSNLRMSRKAPSAEHIFGTDRLGRDLFRRIIHGTRISFTVGVMVVLLPGTVGRAAGVELRDTSDAVWIRSSCVSWTCCWPSPASCSPSRLWQCAGRG